MDTTNTPDFAAAGALELRVIHGPQAGSSLPIEEGKAYTLGTADSCEVLLAGSQIEDEHVSLTTDEDGIQVTPLQGRVMTIDRGEVSSGQMVALGTVLRLGRVKLTIDHVDAPWPHEDALEEPDLPVVAAPVEAPKQEEDEFAFASETRESPVALPVARGKRNLAAPIVLGLTTMLLMGAAVAAWVTNERAKDEEIITESAAPMVLGGAGSKAPMALPAASGASAAAAGNANAVTELIRAFPEATLTSVPNANGGWAITGRVTSEDSRRRLRAAAASLTPPPDVRVMLDSERLAAAQSFVDKRRVEGQVELSVQQTGAGALRIAGAVANQAALTAIVEAAKTDLADAGPVEYAVLLRSELPARFEERLRAAGLAPKFKVLGRDPVLQLQAVLTGPQVLAWENMFRDFTRDYGSVLTVNAQVQHERDTMEAQIETVVAGSFPYVVTTGGRRIAPGGVLDGRTLVAIRDGELVFSDGLRLRYGY